jgi:hypothetical protein
MAAETWLRHRLDALLAVQNALLRAVSHWWAAEQMGALQRWRDNQVSPAPSDPDSAPVHSVRVAQVELMTALAPFPIEDLPAVYAQAQQDALHANEGEKASLNEIHAKVNEVKEELHRLALRHPVGRPPARLAEASDG